jgi:hypothetical protein
VRYEMHFGITTVIDGGGAKGELSSGVWSSNHGVSEDAGDIREILYRSCLQMEQTLNPINHKA